MALELTNDNFQSEVLDSDKVSMVDFWAEWCGPCKMIGPIIDELAKEYEGKATIGKVNVDNERDIANQYSVSGIPTILYIKNGQVVDRHVGRAPKNVLQGKLDALLAN
ncbi:MAG: thioredoxin [Chitinophagales bacterium]